MAVLRGEEARQAVARARRRARLASRAPSTPGHAGSVSGMVVPMAPTGRSRRAEIFRRTADRLLAG